jgi:predicted acyltransferase
VRKLLEKLRASRWLTVILAILLVLLALSSRLAVAYYLASDEPGDGIVYAQMATNILEHGVYSTDTSPPFEPTFIRLPGYPLFVAAVYSLFGHGNNTAVRVTQAVIDTFSCILIAILAWQWTEAEDRRRRSAFWAFILAVVCPFIVIYAATILTETLTTFFALATATAATFALKTESLKRRILWWILTGLLAGSAVYLRPDSGLFAAGIGVTLVISGLFFRRRESVNFGRRVTGVFRDGAIFSAAFLVMLVPWTIRNFEVFGIFQPLSPAHGEMPGEFVPRGYQMWLRTWVDDPRYIGPTLWEIGQKRLHLKQLPTYAFDSEDERLRVAALLEQYNRQPAGTETKAPNDEAADSDDSTDSADSGDDSADSKNDAPDDRADSADDSSDDKGDSADDNADDKSQDKADDADSTDDEDVSGEHLSITPEIDSSFGQLAAERIERSPARYYAALPFKRAAALWFDTHSAYYPFEGEISPMGDLDYDGHQHIWLPLFGFAMLLYTFAGLAGLRRLWRSDSVQWLLLVLLMTLPRLGFFSTIENPEPRYVVELFAFTAILGGLWLGQYRSKKRDADVPDENSTNRLLSLDVFRGITIAAMVLVNTPGTWDAIYPPLEHAEWNGWTPTDLVFPFFLFIAGVSLVFSLGRKLEIDGVGWRVYLKILKRAVVLFLLGLALNAFPFFDFVKGQWFDSSTVRIMGVLQRIAICYLAAALIYLKTNWKQQAVIAAILLAGYWALITLINVPGCDVSSLEDRACNLPAYIDRLILTEPHIWEGSKTFDPEGLLSTIPAIATTIFGLLCGQWLRLRQTGIVRRMFLTGSALTLAGWIWSFWFPINKSLWTSSYSVFTAGLAVCFLAALYWIADEKGRRRLFRPFEVFGVNALALYVGSTIVESILSVVQIPVTEDQTLTLQEVIFSNLFLPLAAPADASLLYALSFVLLWLIVMWLLYWRRIFIKL